MLFNETTNNDFILLSKQSSTHLTYSTENVFVNFVWKLPGCSHWLRDLLTRLVSFT